MRDYEQQHIALECLKLAASGRITGDGPINMAERFYAFVTGEDEDGAKAKLDAVRAVVT